jgi:uncharacterized glyoxalase superfamily protein PhnB
MVQTARVAAGTMYPCLFYQEPAAAIDWLASAFGFETLLSVPGHEPGTIAHAELRLGDGVVMLGTAQHERGFASPRDIPATNQGIYIYIVDVDEHYERARAAGAEIIQAPRDEEYGERGYAARDLEGHFWSFGSYHPAG